MAAASSRDALLGEGSGRASSARISLACIGGIFCTGSMTFLGIVGGAIAGAVVGAVFGIAVAFATAHSLQGDFFNFSLMAGMLVFAACVIAGAAYGGYRGYQASKNPRAFARTLISAPGPDYLAPTAFQAALDTAATTAAAAASTPSWRPMDFSGAPQPVVGGTTAAASV